MRTINSFLLASGLLLSVFPPALAEDATDHSGHDMAAEHGGQIFHMFTLETAYGAGPEGGVASWDLDGWIGTDDNKLWLKSEGEHTDGTLEAAEFWAMYSRNIADFWDAQIGVRYDAKPTGTTYGVLGLSGLAPYWFETEAHLFISDHGDISAKLHAENEFLVTQKLIFEPYAELNLSAQDVAERDIGAGFTDGKIGLQTRYEVTRKFAPYLDVHYGRKLGRTASVARSHGEDTDEIVGAIGLRFMF